MAVTHFLVTGLNCQRFSESLDTETQLALVQRSTKSWLVANRFLAASPTFLLLQQDCTSAEGDVKLTTA